MAIFSHKGRTYHAAQCQNCEASATITDKTLLNRWRDNGNMLDRFDAVMPCCQKPNYMWLIGKAQDVG